jgi:acyl carrier protein
MKRADLRDIVAGVLEVDPNSLGPSVDLNAIDTYDSVSVLTLMIALDEQAGIKISPADASAVRYFGDIERLAKKQGIDLVEE